jgi:hypothetical protein
LLTEMLADAVDERPAASLAFAAMVCEPSA